MSQLGAQLQPIRRPAIGRRAIIVGSAVSFAFLLLNLWPLIDPFEDFPLTSAPMFAHYVNTETPRYRFRLTAERAGGEVREIRATDLGLAGVEFSRDFFGSVYGSIDRHSPFAPHGADSPAAFRARLRAFFGDMAHVLRRRNPERWRDLRRIRLAVVRLGERNQDLDAHEVGFYTVDSGRFTHTWPAPP